MRETKMMALTALAIFALVALAGASTASATRLCQTNTSPCTSIYPSGTAFHGNLLAGTTFAFEMSGSPIGVNPTITCTTSTIGFVSQNTGGASGTPDTLQLSALSLQMCTSMNPTGCEGGGTVGPLAAAHGQITWTSGVNGTLELVPPTVTFACPFLGTSTLCTFGGSGTFDATVTGGSAPVLDVVNQTAASTGGFGCPTGSRWNARYALSKALFVTNS